MQKDKETYTFELGGRPVDAWSVNVKLTIAADKYIKSFREDGSLPLWLDKIIHEITWHLGYHTARWINDNKDLVKKFAIYDELSKDDQNIITLLYRASLKKLKKEEME